MQLKYKQSIRWNTIAKTKNPPTKEKVPVIFKTLEECWKTVRVLINKPWDGFFQTEHLNQLDETLGKTFFGEQKPFIIPINLLTDKRSIC